MSNLAVIPTRLGQLINHELDEARTKLRGIGPAVAIYGGARIEPQDRYYVATLELARSISAQGYNVVSGGGPGIMEAANRGAQLGGRGVSIGLNIELPNEQRPNDFQDVSIGFKTFAARKIAFCKYSRAFVVMPGGVGTLDELFEVLTLVQTGKMPELPVLLYDSTFWSGLLVWMREQLLDRGLICRQDIDERLRTVDSPEVVLEVLRTQHLAGLPAAD